jgi:hypothetical protein
LLFSTSSVISCYEAASAPAARTSSSSSDSLVAATFSSAIALFVFTLVAATFSSAIALFDVYTCSSHFFIRENFVRVYTSGIRVILIAAVGAVVVVVSVVEWVYRGSAGILSSRRRRLD